MKGVFSQKNLAVAFRGKGSVFVKNGSLSPQISLSTIPSALQCLDLPPDDAQLLLVFKNTVLGWTSTTNRPEEIGVKLTPKRCM
jgi:hypothetical protein